MEKKRPNLELALGWAIVCAFAMGWFFGFAANDDFLGEAIIEVVNTPEDYGAADLKAQQEMAQAAWATVLVSVFAFVGLLVTIFYARRAWQAAEGVSRQTSRIGEAQVRAYLSCVGGEFCSTENELVVRPSLKNNGHSPASNINVDSITLFQVPSKDEEIEGVFDEWFLDRRHTNFRVDDIAPGEVENACIEFLISEKMLGSADMFIWNVLSSKMIQAWVTIEYSWTDVFGQVQQQAVSLGLEPDEASVDAGFCGSLDRAN